MTDRSEGPPPERRERPTAQFAVDPTPLKLRQTLSLADAALASVEPTVARRVRILLTEVIGRSSDPRRNPGSPINIEIGILEASVRVDVSGPDLLIPPKQGESAIAGDAVLPNWLLDDMADQWGVDARNSEPAMWFLVEYGQA